MSTIRIKSDKIIVGESLFDGYLYIDGDKITELSKEEKEASVCYDYTGKYVSPGFIETHTHGAGGHAFINSTVEDVIEGCNCHFEHGVTTILPTVTSGPFPNMKAGALNIVEAIKSGKAKPNVLGAHMEGPYLSLKQCGAQCPDFITPPVKEDYVPFIEEYGEYVARWTYAPENDENGEFTKYLVDHNVIPSAGHSDAIYDEMKPSIANGCKLITHLYSSCSTITRLQGFRRLGVIEAAYLNDDIYVEIIADGRHLPIDLIKMIIKIKGTDKVMLVTDSLEIACTDIKEGVMSGTEFIVEEGVCRLKDRSAFAGSIATADRLIRVIAFDCGFSIPTAVKMMTEVPAKILKINKGTLEAGKDADIIVFDDDINVSDIFVNGKKEK
ncbi:MAG: N-acetylglucosamine-6-phosphate deacetylase [Ruminococcaceae bacterium]|nr:N-acetylglucosamine-6-phosphate deacetylase [Oscillospiraceae bacterium]